MSMDPSDVGDTVKHSRATSEALDDTLSLSRTGETSSSSPALVGALTRGELVGRYVILSTLGAGGMGVVYLAFDPELGRKVAIKLLRPGTRAVNRTEGRARLLREAQALAKLSHPNVVAIHDVGTVGERVWIAMEFVEGCPLGDWRREAPRVWREVVDVMTRAGEGLAAAHAVGLLHRDFKPDNVMVGGDGRVRVMDFGLARARDDEPADGVARDVALARGESLDVSVKLTRAGSLMGTPAYMSPEQFHGGDVTPASDQFAFCVTLWEMLYGVRPHEGATLMAIATAVESGRLRAAPRAARVPAWLRRTCERGLVPDPAGRHASMRALLIALRSGQRRRRRRQVSAVAIALGIAAVGALAYQRHAEARQLASCAAAGDEIDDVWNDDVRARVRASMLATATSYAETTAVKITPWLDTYADAWRAARRDACVDTRVRARWDEDTLDRSLWCLDERRMGFSALIQELVQADATVVQRALSAAVGLSRVEPCRDEDLLARLGAPPTRRRAEVRSVRAQLSRVDAQLVAGRYKQGEDEGSDALARAEALAWPPLLAAARIRVAWLHEAAADYPRARELMTQAYFDAASAEVPEAAAAAAIALAGVVGNRMTEYEQGLLWGRLAGVELDRLEAGDHGLRRGKLHNNIGAIHYAAGKYDEARAHYERALSTYEQLLGPDHPSVAVPLDNLANTLDATGDYADARRMVERALAIREEAFGPDHPRVGTTHINLANVLVSTGEHALAREHYERALAILEAALGEEHLHVAIALNGIAGTCKNAGDLEGAQRMYERVLEVWKRVLGPEHQHVAATLHNLAQVHKARGDDAAARELYERAQELWEAALGPEHPALATNLHNLGILHLETGALERARPLLERARAIRERAFDADHPMLAYSYTGLAELELAEGHVERAVELARRAVKIRERGDEPATLLARSQLALARALWASGRERDQARALARQAAEVLRGLDDAAARAQLAKIDEWRAHVDAEEPGGSARGR